MKGIPFNDIYGPSLPSLTPFPIRRKLKYDTIRKQFTGAKGGGVRSRLQVVEPRLKRDTERNDDNDFHRPSMYSSVQYVLLVLHVIVLFEINFW